MSSPAIVLLILFILVAAASLFLYYLRRRLRRSQPVRHSANAPVPPQHSQSRRRQVSPAPSSSGLLLLPRFKFSDLKRPGSVTVGGDCAICLAEFEPEHQLRLLPLCLHAFHVDCIDTWLAGESLICPVCRAEVFRSDSDLLLQTASSAGGSFRLAIGNVSRGRRQDNSSSRTHSIRGGEFEYVVDEEWELQLRDAILPVHDVEDEDDEIVAVVIDSQPPLPSTVEYQSSCGMIFTGSSRRWTELSEGLEMIYRWLS